LRRHLKSEIYALLCIFAFCLVHPGYVNAADSCPPVVAPPKVLIDARETQLAGGVPMNFEELLKDPDVQAYAKVEREHAQGDWGNLCRYREANRALTPPTRVVFMGDSITENWVVADPGVFKQGIVGRGISGQTSPQMLLRFFQDVIELHPKVVHLMAGTNDVAGNTGPTTDEDIENNVRAMVELAHTHHIRAVIASIPPASVFSWKPELKPAERIQWLNAWLKDYARRTSSQYVDYYSILTDGQGGMKHEFSSDGVHPNRDGYAAMRSLAEKAIL
jgi:lysophospholipase L1-like esterase